MSTTERTYIPNGRHTYNTSVSKFLIGGRYLDALTGSNKIVNGLDDPSHLAFVFGIVAEPSGLFGNPETFGKMYADFETDRQYSALEYLLNCKGSPQDVKSIQDNTMSLGANYEVGELTEDELKLDKSKQDEILASRISAENDRLNKNVTDKYKQNTERQVSADATIFSKEYLNMRAFVNGFWEICKGKQYMFQTVDGLQDAYKKYYNNKKDSFLGGSDNKIKITCLESMDLRMAALFDSYYKAVYNHKYRRMNVPHNLIKFNCYIMLHDLRNVVPPDGSTYFDSLVVRNMSTVVFVFKNCTIDIEECGQTFSSIANTEVNETKFDFTFTYDDIDIAVDSLADFLESKQAESYDNPHREMYDTLDIVSLNDYNKITDADYTSAYGKTRNTNKLVYGESEMFGNAYEDDFTLNVGNILKKAGSLTFNYLTNGTQMGNVYDESWAGIVANLVSSISTGGLHSIASQYISKGKTIAMEKLDNYARERFGNNGGGETNVLTNTDLNPDNPNRGARPSGYGGTRSVSNGTLGNLDMNPRNAPSGPTKTLGQI